GIRRIEAITGEYAENILDELEDTIIQIKSLLNNAPDVLVALRKSLNENAALRKQADGYIQDYVSALREQLIKDARLNGKGISVMRLQGQLMPEVVKRVATALRGSGLEHHALIAGTENDDRPMLTVMLTDDLVKEGMNAGQMVREIAKLIQGGGGGQPGFAQAGGKNLDGLSLALDKLEEVLNQ
ncbi:MAG: alanine--tRNA ligase, partial [Muribaculaceae bacterium]|nr:alanine--tRNA ligase [Muribaculaceae bacterium]